MKYNDIILAEYTRKSYMTLNGIMPNLRANYSKYFSLYKKPIIFRGGTYEKPIYYIDSSTSERQSANTTNEYTWLLSTLSNWAMYPKRSRSIICTSDRSTAYSYGGDYFVIPRNDARFGVCPKEDLWVSFKAASTKMMDSFNDDLRELISSILNQSPAKTYDRFIKQLRLVNDKLNSIENIAPVLPPVKNKIFTKIPNGILSEFKKAKEKNNKITFIGFLAYTLDPVHNNFKLANISNLGKYVNLKSGNEIWTDSPCYVFDSYELSYDNIRNQVLGSK